MTGECRVVLFKTLIVRHHAAAFKLRCMVGTYLVDDIKGGIDALAFKRGYIF